MSQPIVKLTKRQKTYVNLVERNKPYPAMDAMKLMKQAATAKFDESVDIAVNLGIDAKKSDQTVRGSVVLPAGTGKKVRVAVFAQGDKATAAKSAGADIVGMEDLAEQIKAGIVQCTIGLASFAPEALCENLKALLDALNRAKPATSKGIYLQKLSVSSTMGPGIRVDIASVNA